MNIYLDVDGVLIRNASPQKDIINFIDYILDNYPDRVYWLTSFYRQGFNGVEEVLKGELPSDIINKMMTNIKPTSWKSMKTEGINLDEPFVWFDDNLGWREKIVLEANGCAHSHVLMNRLNPSMATEALDYLRVRTLTK